ncbi:DUF444 domain-containing protein YeaH [Rhodovastum atsumiense]|uniref:UPF0229 protein F1189_24610 n=1 Tax=Rhodovastum atsumiense TaxID=504468 RepID=A0A5M6IMA1_9PROT|nr:YeaH/YhbH family protein [Rhodovastum atsumiense]KAA5609380.1 YeaH/YhbH family protein [Rhodovastum atsumiense]CAH2598594.1 DUF444 domain-containing protein YeaH [Rhodovastum atsumiense]
MIIVDRRPNPQGKSLPNRQRFLSRVKAQVRRAVADSIDRRRVSDVGAEEEVKVRVAGTSEPHFRIAPGGDGDYVVPGTGTLNRGDRIPKPQGGGGGRGREAADSGGGEDAFEFTLSREEFLDFFFEELELPRLARTQLGEATLSKPRRAGFTVSGSPTALDVRRTMRNSLARRVALRRPDREEIEEAQAEVAAAIKAHDDARLARARAHLDLVLRRTARIPFVDPIDVRYRRHERVKLPASDAVMFCLMDVSGSMTEHMKGLAKRFFMLLHLFLERKYTRVHVVFIRHTEKAQEVDEDTFFRSRETGGTIVSSALTEMLRVQSERFPPSDYNIYVAQASDGDNLHADAGAVVELMGRILPLVRYFAYVETGHGEEERFGIARGLETSLWGTYRSILGESAPQLAMRKLSEVRDVWGVFADLFRKNPAGATP